MNSYSQSGEDKFVLQYFGEYKGTLLEIGANDGVTLSNSRLLIENGWTAHLVEPGWYYAYMIELYRNSDKVKLWNVGIGETEGTVKFWISGAHVPGGTDKGLVSTFKFEETKRWPHVEFTEKKSKIAKFGDFYSHMCEPKLDFISIDAEGMDWIILQQIDLTKVGCKCLCIEWNGNEKLRNLFVAYCEYYGMDLMLVNNENLIFGRV